MLGDRARKERVLLRPSPYREGDDRFQEPPGYGQTLSRLIDPVAFPALHQAIASGALDDQDGLAGEFEFGFGIILSGIDALIATATASPHRT
jgi:hypothetical protein